MLRSNDDDIFCMAQQVGSPGTEGPADALPLELATLDAVIDYLLAHEPPLHALALAETALAVSMPANVPIDQANVLKGVGSTLELCLPADLTGIVEAWERARRTGGAQVVVHLRADPELPVTLHIVDARRRYGVFLGFLVGGTGQLYAEAMPVRIRPTVCTWERNELAVIVDIDAATTAILGWTRADMIGKRTLELVHPDDVAVAIANWMDMLARPGTTPRPAFRYRHRDGSYVWLENTHDNRLADPLIGRVISQLVDVSERMIAVEALRRSEGLLRRLTDALPVGVVQIDAHAGIVHANKRLGELVGASGATTLGELFARAATAGREALDIALADLLATGVAAELQLTIDGPHGPRRCNVDLRSLRNDDGQITGAIACVADVTEQSAMREELERRATFDQLTNCYNRGATLERLEAVLRAPSATNAGIAALFVDLDRFKETNDCFGHAAGDELLRRVAARLLHGARENDIVGRLGGDEFLLIAKNVATPEIALEIARRTIATIARRTVIDTQTIMPQASVGIAWTNQSIETDALVARADAAMYESKRNGTGPVLWS